MQEIQENAVNSMEKLLFKVGNVYGGVAGLFQKSKLETVNSLLKGT